MSVLVSYSQANTPVSVIGACFCNLTGLVIYKKVFQRLILCKFGQESLFHHFWSHFLPVVVGRDVFAYPHLYKRGVCRQNLVFGLCPIVERCFTGLVVLLHAVVLLAVHHKQTTVEVRLHLHSIWQVMEKQKSVGFSIQSAPQGGSFKSTSI